MQANGENVNFDEKVWKLTSKIPKGKVTTYKIIAEKLGTRAYRAVGNALNKNPHAPFVPCHRVVGSNGSLTGFAHGLKRKAQMLRAEGIEIKKNKIFGLEKFIFRF